MNRKDAITLTKKALRVIAADDVSAQDIARLNGQKAHVAIESRGGNTLAEVTGKIQTRQNGYAFICVAGKNQIVQPYASVDRAKLSGRSIVLEDEGIRWVITPS